MKLSSASAGRIAVAAIACGAVALPVTALAVPGHAGHAREPARAAHRCTSFRTRTWLGLGNGGGALGTTFYPLEFSNSGKRACWLFGYPAVLAVSGTGQQIGLPAVASGRRHVVVLQPGGTAHVVLGLVDAGLLSGCQQRKGAFLKVIAPGQQPATFIPSFTFTACADKSVLRVDAVHPGTGIPGFTAS
jgi:hypothetical protein